MPTRTLNKLFSAAIAATFTITVAVRWRCTRLCWNCGEYSFTDKSLCRRCADQFRVEDEEAFGSEMRRQRQEEYDQSIQDTYDSLDREFWDDVAADIADDERLGVLSKQKEPSD